MTYLEINAIVARHFGISTDDLVQSRKYATGASSRAAAMLICHEVLKASTIKLAKWYGKHQHTTPLRALRICRNLIITDEVYKSNYTAAFEECVKQHHEDQIKEAAMKKLQQMYEASLQHQEAEKKNIKQIYNLNHRVRKKGISVRTRSRTLSCSEEQLNEINDTQLSKLLNEHHYAIQLSIL